MNILQQFIGSHYPLVGWQMVKIVLVLLKFLSLRYQIRHFRRKTSSLQILSGLYQPIKSFNDPKEKMLVTSIFSFSHNVFYKVIHIL